LVPDHLVVASEPVLRLLGAWMLMAHSWAFSEEFSLATSLYPNLGWPTALN